MKYSSIYIKTKKEVSAELESKNGQLLTRAGFIHQEMAGVYTYLPLGLIVLKKISDIVRKNMNTIGSELLMSSLSPFSNWQATNRLESVDVLLKVGGANEPSKLRNSAEYILNPTHEDMITPLVKESVFSYRDLPLALYQIQTKFRNEPRAKSGLMRTREFLMKDLYSFHESEEDLYKYYEKAKEVYLNTYKELGIGDDTYLTMASGGDFTTNFSHEFQILVDTGEDTIYLDRKNKIGYNKEIVNEENAQKLSVKFQELEQVKACEIGNIFPLGTKYSKAIDFYITNAKGERTLVWMGSYGIGVSRLMGVIAEKFNDAKGLIWPEVIAPFKYHLISITKDKSSEVYKKAQAVYDKLIGNNIEVLWDDRLDVSAGEKLNEADLLGVPYRVVISDKTLANNKVELKQRNSNESVLVEENTLN